METNHRDEVERTPGLLHRLFAQSRRPAAPVQIKEHHHGPAVDLALTFSELSTYQAEVLKRVATQLVDLTSVAREENFEARVRSIMRAFAPEDPEADVLLKLAGDDARARQEWFSQVPVLDSKQVAERAGYSLRNAAQTAWRWRTAGKIFSISRGGVDYYPAFQFGDDGQPLPIIGRVLEILRTDTTRTDWQNAFWFAGANGWLGGAAPKDLLHSDPDRVVEAAKHAVATQEY